MKALKGIILFFISLSVLAGAVPQEKLNLANAYIKILLSEYSEEGKLTINSATTDDSTNKLTNIATTLELYKYGAVKLGLGLVNKEVALNATFDYIEHEGEFNTPEKVTEFLEELNRELEEYNNKGIYKASLSTIRNDKETLATLTLKPVSPEAVSIKVMTLNAKIPYGAGETVSFNLNGKFNAKADLVTSAQDGLTGIFTSLINEEEPQDSDFDKILKVVRSVLKDL